MTGKHIRNKTVSGSSDLSKILPGATEIYQPNRITNSKYIGITLLQSRILVCLIKELQQAILSSMNGKNWRQLNLFPSDNPEMIRVPIPLKLIAKPRQYPEVYQAAIELAKVNIQLPSSVSKEYFTIATLFPKVHLPKIVKGNSIIYVELFKSAAHLLIEIDKTGNGQPGFFTKYLFEVAMRARNKYTYKLYMIISSWKSKGAFRMNVSELKAQLGINPREYSQYKAFKKRVLNPVRRELENNSDCWFCFTEHRVNRKVEYLNFRIIVPASSEVLQQRIDYLAHLLYNHFQISAEQFKSLDPIRHHLADSSSYQKVLLKLQELHERIAQPCPSISDVPTYVIKSLHNALS